MQRFLTVRDAKELLVGRIVAEAQRESIPLSEVERKMLYFSEIGWTLPGIAEVSDAFDRDYDQVSYEEKIGTLVRNFCAYSHKTNSDEFDAWEEAVRTIHREDHYLLVLIAAGGKLPSSSGVGFLKLVAIGFAITCAVLGIAYLFIRS